MDLNPRAVTIARRRLAELGVDACEERVVESDEGPSAVHAAAAEPRAHAAEAGFSEVG
jgi:hypothetical protein